MEFLEKYKLFSKSQFGFGPRFSTTFGTNSSLDEMRKNVNQGKLVGARYIDLSNAVDTISHSSLLQKLCLHGIKISVKSLG